MSRFSPLSEEQYNEVIDFASKMIPLWHFAGGLNRAYCIGYAIGFLGMAKVYPWPEEDDEITCMGIIGFKDGKGDFFE